MSLRSHSTDHANADSERTGAAPDSGYACTGQPPSPNAAYTQVVLTTPAW